MAKKKRNIIRSYVELDKLVTRVFADTSAPGVVDAAYLFAETEDNEKSVLQTGLFLYEVGPARRVAICEYHKAAGYPGFESWQKKLIKKGVKASDIIGIPHAPEFPPSTDAEALGLVRFARAHDWKKVYVTAPPLHQLRAFLSTVSAVVHERSKLLVYSFPGLPQSWEQYVVHSQGIQKGVRSELLAEELVKIERYYRKGDLVSAKEVLKYLDKRDKQK